MNTYFETNKGIGILTITGRLDASNHEILKQKFQTLQDETNNFIFDLSSLDFLDSTGLGSLVYCLKSALQNNGNIKISHLNPKPKLIFDTTRAYKLFEIYDTIELALLEYNAKK